MYHENKLSLAAPLSGIEEKAGDGVFAKNDNLVLVEFKRSYAEIGSEEKKFVKYKNAEAQLKGQDGHHFIVYGVVEEGDCALTLHAQTYFSKVKIYHALDLIERGVEENKFMEYVKTFIMLKKKDKRSTEESSSRSVKSVIGVSPNGSVISISLAEYVRIALPGLYPALELEVGSSLDLLS